MHPGRLADLTDLACPPYDVISELQRHELESRDPHNAVRLELPHGDDPHAAAAATLAAWTADGTLEREPEARFYYYVHARPVRRTSPRAWHRRSACSSSRGARAIRPHEHTMPGPKADRLALLHATQTQLSPILVCYFDRSERYRYVMSRPWTDEWRARDADGLLHQVGGDRAGRAAASYLSRQRLFMADGHHRYETALAYQAEVRVRPGRDERRPARWRPTGSCACWSTPSSRSSRCSPRIGCCRCGPRPAGALVEARPADLRAAPDQAARRWRAAARRPLPGLRSAWDPGTVRGCDNRRGRASRSGWPRAAVGTAVRRLDLSCSMPRSWTTGSGIRLRLVGAGERLAYTRERGRCARPCARGAADAAFLVRPTQIDQLAAVANAGDIMPQKSTYFYPKLLTGMVFNPLFEAEDFEERQGRWCRRSSATRSTSSRRASTSRRQQPERRSRKPPLAAGPRRADRLLAVVELRRVFRRARLGGARA